MLVGFVIAGGADALESIFCKLVFDALSAVFLIGISRPSPRPSFPAGTCGATGLAVNSDAFESTDLPDIFEESLLGLLFWLGISLSFRVKTLM